jgi:hypothetical protein
MQLLSLGDLYLRSLKTVQLLSKKVFLLTPNCQSFCSCDMRYLDVTSIKKSSTFEKAWLLIFPSAINGLN